MPRDRHYGHGLSNLASNGLKDKLLFFCFFFLFILFNITNYESY